MNSNEYYISLDIGTSSVKVIIGEMVGETLNIIGVGNVKSNGLKKGSIVDIDETVKTIKKAIEQAERMVGILIDRVIVGINANHVQLVESNGVVAVSSPDKVIGDEDVARVIDAARVISVAPEREIIDVVPKQFVVDGVDGIKDPRVMMGVRLEVEGTLITGSKTYLHNIIRCVERAGLEVVDICLQPLAASTICLSADEKNYGVGLIDIGGGQTTVSVFKDNAIVDTFTIPLGGENITKDISIVMKISTEEAEKIKLKYGHAFYDTASRDVVFSVPSGGNEHHQYNQLELCDMIEARLEEILVFVYQELRRRGYKHLANGYVLTGGTAFLPGIAELTQHIFENHVRVAIPDYIGVREPQYTNGVGLLQFYNQMEKLKGKNEVARKETAVTFEQEQPKSKPVPQKKQKKQKVQEENVSSKMKKLFRYLWE
ncbi:MAG: cell division protein FtsA [Bacillaceae bacterium]